MAPKKTIQVNQGYVEISPIFSELYGTTTAVGSLEQAINSGVLPCGDGCDYRLNWEDKGEIMKQGVILEVTEDKYFEMLEVLPPMYVDHVDGKKVESGFAVTEVQYFSKGGAVFSIYWKEGKKYFHAWGTLSDNGKPVNHPELHEYNKGIKATIVKAVRP